MSVEQLVQAVPPLAGREPSSPDWEAIEGELGSRLPTDYKRLVEVYGPGSFDDFVHIYQPHAPWEQLDLKHEVDGELWALKYLRDQGQDIPYRLEDPAELMALGRDENGDQIFWQRTDLGDPDTWPVVVKDARANEWFTHDGGVTDFLRAVLLHEITVPLFPEDFPSEHPVFAPYEDV